MPRRGQYSRAADTPRAFRAWPVPCPRRQARLRLTMQHCGALGPWLRRQQVANAPSYEDDRPVKRLVRV